MAIAVNTDQELNKLLGTPINKLPLSLINSPLEKHINRLYHELKDRHINFFPKCYLSDEWGCPYNTPLIGIPFYLADETLTKLEGKFTDTEAENDHEVMMYLRHEAGHALNYAYRLFLQYRWKKIFGLFSRPYRERYQWIPNHKAFVVHLPDWYAQKHPDEDFAETFAVWLTPEIDWKNQYKDTPALMKLEYVGEIVQSIASSSPVFKQGSPDMPVEEIDMTLKEWYESQGLKNGINLQ